MFDHNVYGAILNAAFNILRNNGQQIPRQFAEGFMFDHDTKNGHQSQRNAAQLFDFVTREAQRLNNGQATIRDDQQLFGIVGLYVEDIFRRWAATQQGGGLGGGMGGFRQSNMGFGGGSSLGGGGGLFNRGGGGMGFGQPSRTGPGSHLMDDVIEPAGSRQQQVQPQAQPVAQNSSLSFTSSTPKKEDVVMTQFSYNPLDDIPESGLDFAQVPEPVNWGIGKPNDNSIVMMGRHSLKTKDDRYVIRVCDGFERIYFNDPMDVAKDFFRIVPDFFLAESFIFRVFYNHVEEIDIPTKDFLDVRNKFVAAIDRDRERPVYNILMSIIDQMLHGPRKALVNYLVKHINRALALSCGMSANPATRISFTQIEDLEELLGTNFQHKLLEVPNARIMIAKIVNNAILNALTGCSDALFASSNANEIDVIKNSPVFPYSMPEVYPNKAAIPASGSPQAKKFFDQLHAHQLNHKTYVRSLRSVIFTNVLGQKVLPIVGDKPTLVNGQIAALFNQYNLPHLMQIRTNESQCSYYDETGQTGGGAEAEYAQFLEDPERYMNDETKRFIEREAPELPVDQTIFAIQFKKSPTEYLAALDLATTMDSASGRGYALFAKKKLGVLKPTV